MNKIIYKRLITTWFLSAMMSIATWGNLPVGPNHQKAHADSLYTAGKYAEAIETYNAILTEAGVSSDVFYNLGNSYYKAGDMAHAILNYERSLKLDPSDSDTRHNLSLAREQIKDKGTSATEFFLQAWWHSFANFFSLNVLKTTGWLSFVVFLTTLLLLHTKRIGNYRKYVKILSYIAITVCILAHLATLQQYHSMVNDENAIVMSSSATVKSSPSENSTDLYQVHAGSRLSILDDSMKEWCEVRIGEDKEGWILKTDIELI